MTPKEKYNDINLSKLPEKAVEQLNRVKPFLFEEKFQKAEYAENLKKAEQGMDKLYDIISDKYPESVKSKVKKQPEPQTPVAIAKQAAQETVNQPKKGKSTASAGKTKRGNVINLAKEIRKEGESWTEARRRAGQMIQAQKKKAVTKANKQYEKLKAFLTANPMIEKTEVTYGSKSAGWSKRPISVNRDAPRKALPAGRRIAKKSKNVYYEYRANRTDKQRNRYPYLALGGKLHGAGMFADGGKFGEEYDLKVLSGLSGFNNGQTLNGLLESMGLSNYRFNKYATQSQLNKVKKSLNNLIKKGYVEESGLGYTITQSGANYLRSFDYGSYAKGGKTEKNLEKVVNDYEKYIANYDKRISKYQKEGDKSGVAMMRSDKKEHEAILSMIKKEDFKKAYMLWYDMDTAPREDVPSSVYFLLIKNKPEIKSQRYFVKNGKLMKEYDYYAKGGGFGKSNEYWERRENLERFLNYTDENIYWKWVNGELTDLMAVQLVEEIHGEKFNPKTKYAKGGEITQSKAKKIFAEFEKNEDENYHSENVILLAKHFGTAAELKEAKAILKEHEEAGSLTSALRKRRDSLYDKLMPKLRTALKAKK